MVGAPGIGDSLWLGIDLGGTNAKAAIISDEGAIIASEQQVLDDLRPRQMLDKILDCAEHSLASGSLSWSHIAGIGIGCCHGWIKDGKVGGAANLHEDWESYPLAQMIRELIQQRAGSNILEGKSVTLLPDCAAVACAEGWIGAASSITGTVVFISLGSGIGVSILKEGKVLSGDHHMNEGGHMIVSPKGRQCSCGQKGCLEALCSAPAVVALAKERCSKGQDRSYHSSLDSILANLTCQDVFAHAKQGDPVACAVVEEVSEWLAIGVINLARVLDPSLIVLSGGMAKAGDQLLELVAKYIKQHTWTVLPTHQRLECARVGADVVGLVGAAAAAREEARSRSPRGAAEAEAETSGNVAGQADARGQRGVNRAGSVLMCLGVIGVCVCVAYLTRRRR
jgi:glucokinase